MKMAGSTMQMCDMSSLAATALSAHYRLCFLQPERAKQVPNVVILLRFLLQLIHSAANTLFIKRMVPVQGGSASALLRNVYTNAMVYSLRRLVYSVGHLA